MSSRPPVSPVLSESDARLWALLLFSSVAYFFTVNHADNDLWGHVFAGREILAHGTIPRVDTYSYTVAGGAWFNHEWLTHVVFAAVYDGAGSAGLLLYKLAAAVAAFTLTLAGIRRRASQPWVWGGVGLLTIAVLARGFAVRPQVFSYAAVALLLYLFDRARQRPAVLWWVPPLFVLWANMHGGFVLGLAIVVAYAAWRAVFDAPLWVPALGVTRPATWSSALLPLGVLALSIVAVMLTPYGPRLLGYLWDELSRSHPITEWQPASPWQSEHASFFLMSTLLAATCMQKGTGLFSRADGWRVLLALGVGLFALRHQRHIPVFALCAAAPLAAQLQRIADRLGRDRLPLGAGSIRLIRVALACVAVFQLGMTAQRLWHDGLQITFDADEYPVAAVRALEAGGARGNLAVPLDWGAYVLWHLAPAIKPSIDGRFATVFPETVVDDNFAFYRGFENWRRLIDHYPTEAVLAPSSWQLPIEREPGWRKVYEDRVAALFVREDRISQFALQPSTAEPRGIFP